MVIRLSLVIGMTLVLTACGFAPLHAPVGGQSAAFQNIRVETLATDRPDDTQSGFFIKQRLRDRIGMDGSAHILQIEPKLTQRLLGISGEDVASRYDYELSTRYTLLDAKTGDVMTKGIVRSTSTFGAPIDPYGLKASEDNAVRTIAADSADRILVKLAAYFAK